MNLPPPHYQDINSETSLIGDLQALVNDAFPKKCNSCGCSFETAEDFVRQTEAIRGKSGLKSAVDDDGRPVVELFRNCLCGSTLMDAFRDRRDTSEAGLRRRAKFGELAARLVARGVTPEMARTELLKVLRGEGSSVLEQLTGCKL